MNNLPNPAGTPRPGNFIFDIETDGLLDELTKIHCLVIKDIDSGTVYSCTDNPGSYLSIADGLLLLSQASLLVGHNVIKFDIPAIQKVVPSFKIQGTVRDTLTLARLVYPSDVLREIDFKLIEKGKEKFESAMAEWKYHARYNEDTGTYFSSAPEPTYSGFPKNMIGRYSLASWGYRLMEYKGDYSGGWDLWSKEMQDYCEQDVEVTLRLFNKLMSKGFSEESIDLEHRVQQIIFRQEQHGFLFDEKAAIKLYSSLGQRKAQMEEELQKAFPPRERVVGVIVPKRDNKTLGYKKGVPFTKTKLTLFNPGSRDHIAEWLTEQRGWKPKAFTAGGKPTVDEGVLAKLPYPEAKVLFEYLTICKRLGQLAEGKEAWLKNIGKDGRIHGTITTNGAVTGRMTHSRPNVAQTPSSRSPYGHEMRGLYIVPPGYKLVGADADALELRDLAGYMARYDKGAYIETVLKGDKSQGTDIHSVNCRALGMDPKKTYPVDGKLIPGRDIAKTWFYAFIYGAGDYKLGETLGIKGSKKIISMSGKKSRENFLKNLPALGRLTNAVKKRVKEKGYLLGLDGRILTCRAEHSALNTLLQSAGAIQMKMALVILDETLQAQGYIPGVDYEFVANVHDEWQIEVREDIADEVGQHARCSIQKAGEHFKFACPLDGSYSVGSSWAETH